MAEGKFIVLCLVVLWSLLMTAWMHRDNV